MNYKLDPISYFLCYLKIEALYKKAHAEIKKDPAFKSVKKTKPADYKQKRWTRKSLTRAQRKDRVKQKKASYLKKMQLAAAE